MSRELYETQCPKCGHMSLNPQVCESCGALLSRMRGRSFTDAETAPGSRRVPAPDDYSFASAANPVAPRRKTSGTLWFALMVVALSGFAYYTYLIRTDYFETPNTTMESRRELRHQVKSGDQPVDPDSIEVDAPAMRTPALTPRTDTLKVFKNIGTSLKSTLSGPSKGKSSIASPSPTIAFSARAIPTPESKRTAAALRAKRQLASAQPAAPTATPAFSTREAPVTIDLGEEMFKTGGGGLQSKPSSSRPTESGGGGGSGSVVAINSSGFNSEVLSHNGGPVLVDFYATWCGPCRMLAPRVEQVASEFGGQLKVVKLDIDASPEITRSYNVRSFPTLLIFKGGREVDRAVGALALDQLRVFVQAQL